MNFLCLATAYIVWVILYFCGLHCSDRTCSGRKKNLIVHLTCVWALEFKQWFTKQYNAPSGILFLLVTLKASKATLRHVLRNCFGFLSSEFPFFLFSPLLWKTGVEFWLVGFVGFGGVFLLVGWFVGVLGLFCCFVWCFLQNRMNQGLISILQTHFLITSCWS